VATESLSELLTGTGGGARVVFGRQAEPVSLGRLMANGSRLFSDRADAETLGILMTNDQPTVEVLLGAVIHGATLVSLPLPGRAADPGAYLAFLAETCQRTGVGEIVVADHVAELVQAAGHPIRRHSDLSRAPLAAPGAAFRLVQFTSGSTEQPKPVIVDDAALGANVSAVLATLAPRPGDALVSWLPLAHDMGLVGMLLTGLAATGPRWAGPSDVVLLDPMAFVRRPGLWIEALSHWRGSFTASPDFGYRLATRRRPAGQFDLSNLRCAIVGGEIIRAETLAAFSEAYRVDGLDPRGLCPAYGMAEMGLAVTMTPTDERWQERRVSAFALADGRLDEPRSAADALVLVSSGRPLPGYAVDAGGDQERSGRLAVRGPSTGLDGITNASFAGPDGWFPTGDVGFTAGDWLYVCGRDDDYLVAEGRNIYAPAVETAVAEVDGVRPGRVTAVGLPSGEWAIVAEPIRRARLAGTEVAALQHDIRRAAVRAATVQPGRVVLARAGALPLTASGKLQRRKVRSLLLKGEFAEL
jgi:fatty-acyl-CoA synthase